MKYPIWAAACLLATATAAHAANISEKRQVLDRDVPAILARHKVPSISLAHIEGGKVVLVAAYGEQSPGIPATPRTLYNVASLTKPIAAEAVLRLAAKGRLSLDEPMYPHWTDPDVAADPRHKLLTPRIALSHRTGFPNWRFLAADNKLAFGGTPGEAIGYSGEGYEWVSRFAARKTGEDFETLARRLVFEPAGMKETSFTYRPWFDGRVATGQDEKGGPVPPVRRDSYLASDDIHTTAEDYARFLLSVMKREGISRGLAAQRETVQASTRPNFCAGEKEKACPREIGFGLGWEVHKYAGGTILFHTGADKGEFTLAFLNPETLTGTVVLTNARGSPPAILDILDRLEVDPELMRFLHSQAGY